MRYCGSELEDFRLALNWKRYFSGRIRKHVRGRVLEVGAGLGESTPFLINPEVTEWTCLEPDPALAEQIRDRILTGRLPGICRVTGGTTSCISGRLFDTVIYIDVLEHIENDAGEISRAASLLEKNGRLIILSPAGRFLFGRFDLSVGHYRRYSRKTLKEAAGRGGLSLIMLEYLDAPGALLSLIKKIFPFREHSPGQVLIWDRFILPFSYILDRLLGYSAGRSLLGVWEKVS